MPASQPIIHLIGGCNGDGKTTFAREYLPKEVHCLRFLNADEIARGLSPFDPVAVAVKAARTLLSEIHELIGKRVTFALESTLGGKNYAHILSHAREQGYRIHIHYLWLPSARIAIARVRQRVKKGGHDVPSHDIRRRFHRSLNNLTAHYAPIADRWGVWDSQTMPPTLMAESETCSLEELKTMIIAR
jgi:predicted ABC-type ATPase